MGKVIGIASHDKKRGPMVVCAAAKVSFEHGIADDFRGAFQNDRQVTIITKENWDAVCADLGRKLHWTTRRANIIIEGIDLKNSTGEILRIGKFFLEITGELEPCKRMDEQFVGLTRALESNWRGGVTCKILSEGVIKEGDDITVMVRTDTE